MAKKSPLSETTKDAIKQAKHILRLARFGAIGVIDPNSGGPLVTRTNVAVTPAGNPIFLMSDLAAHTKAIKQNSSTSLLVGEPGKGDPLAHPRLSLMGKTMRLADQTDQEKSLEQAQRARYIRRHPKAELYNQLPDFFLYEFKIERALFNAGFGKAYEFTRDDLILSDKDYLDLINAEASIIDHLNDDHAKAVEHYAVKLCGQKKGKWVISGVDPEGIDLRLGETFARLDFAENYKSPEQVKNQLVTWAKK